MLDSCTGQPFMKVDELQEHDTIIRVGSTNLLFETGNMVRNEVLVQHV